MSKGLYDGDLLDMFSKYSYYPDNVQSFIYDKAKSILINSSLVNYYSEIEIALVEKLLKDDSIPFDDKIDLLENIFKRLSLEERINLFSLFDIKYGDLLSNKDKKPLFIKRSEENKLLLDILQRNGCIKGYKNRQGTKYYSIQRKFV